MSLTRIRWRLRGAWLWPSFVVLSLIDAAIIHALPPAGDSATWVAGWLAGFVANLIAVAFLGRLGGRIVRRLRRDMPVVVARDYAGAVMTLAITGALLAAGLSHHQTVRADRAALQDATARAEAFIGAHAPAAFQRNLRTLDTYPLQIPVLYRVCATGSAAARYYCVVVDRSKPFGASVRYAGSEPNWVLGQGGY